MGSESASDFDAAVESPSEEEIKEDGDGRVRMGVNQSGDDGKVVCIADQGGFGGREDEVLVDGKDRR
ncbi:unnamed protein product [Linum trigynum]|uniref:Uncharacterized protein n=1 Tax=Linum trigynum TaxID=586398 RepID=A0AAV2F683_9ROSI